MARSFIFIHINKTGGSSVALALGIPLQMHATADEVRQQISPAQWREAFKFAYVRNPWDKVVSHYHYRVQTNQTGLAAGGLDFNQWVRLAYGEKDPRYYDKPRFFMPQKDWVSDRSGRIIVDFVGRFERLQEDFRVVCKTLGIEKTLPHIRKSSHGHYRDYYAEDTREIIGQWFRDDIDAFGYEF
ncbi:MAG TPA: hypothetical protein ENK05_10090 [Gammaproteobacteria bacterium]|nr:hypothetical protein [Gammaproteobacteria bacterium]